jgi:hypothetical protein
MILAPLANATTAYYQPTPYPLKNMYGTTISQDLNKIHIHDGWLNNYYPSIMTFQRDGQLKIGGWGDTYRSYINMDLAGLPTDPTSVTLWMRFYPSGSAVTPFQFCIPNSAWNTTITWNTQPTFLGCTNMQTAPSTDSWAGWYITSWYQNWQSGAWGKYGIMMTPQYINNNFDFIRSSRYADYVNDPYADGKRPIMQFDFTSTVDLKMPVPGNYRWLLTNEIGGYECMGQTPTPDTAHQGSNYFSVDITWNNAYNGTGPTPYGQYNTPIIAAGGGKVFVSTTDSGDNYPNGYYIVIDHDGDGNLNTGVTTRYLHLASAPARKNGTLLVTGNTVLAGDQIGIMGTTGHLNGVPTSTGVHLHFGVRYANNGSVTIPQLTKTTMEGLLLKSYQTECAVNSSGVPTSRIRYYTSTNTLTGN